MCSIEHEDSVPVSPKKRREDRAGNPRSDDDDIEIILQRH
jgi:hypothetical protein